MDRNIGAAAATNANGNRVAQCRPSFLFVAPTMTEAVERDTQTERASERAKSLLWLLSARPAGVGGQENPIFEFLPFAWLFQMEITAEAARGSEWEGGKGREGRKEGRKAGACLDGINGFGYSRRRRRHFGFPLVSTPRANFELEMVPRRRTD